MGHKEKNRQNTGKKQLSYRQIIFLCLGAQMAVMFLIFFVYAYFDFREECRESALREARVSAENIAAWTDEYISLADGIDVNAEMSAWEQGIRVRVGTNERVVVLDAEGQTLFSSDQALIELCQEVLYEESESPILSAGGGIFLAVGISAPETREWNCIVFHDVAEEIDNYHFRYGRVALLLLLSVISISMAAYLIYRPINRLLKTVDGEMGQKAHGKNELAFLSEGINALKDDSRKLRIMMLQKQDKLQEMFTLRLIRGDITLQEEYEEYVRDLNLHPWQYFVAIVAVLNLREEEDDQSNIKEDAICLKIVEEMPEQLKKLAWIPPVYNACAIAAILGADDEDLLMKHIEEYYTELQNFSKDICGYQLLTGVSATHTDPRQMGIAYRESVHALTRSESSGGREIHPVSDTDLSECHFYLTGITPSEIPYDASYEKKMQSGIKNMDKVQCYQAADEFFRYLAEENYHQDEIMVYVLQFVNSIILTAMEIKVDMEVLYPDGLSKLFKELMEILEPSRERRYIKRNLVDRILEARNELMEKRSYSLLEDIEQLIHKKKGNISLAECAESLGVHTTYIWKVLKTERGKTFSDFLEEYKVEEAKRLLLNTNMTVAEIAITLNYTNAQNFIRFFSKSTGMTPGKFRKLY